MDLQLNASRRSKEQRQLLLYRDSLAKDCVLSYQLRANEFTDVFKSISAHYEVLVPQMILVTIDNELFEPKLWSWIDPHGLVLMAIYVCFDVELSGLQHSVASSASA